MTAYEDSIQMMKDGLADAFTLATASPASQVSDLASARDIKILSIPKDKIQEMLKFNPAYIETSVPANIYKGQTAEVKTFGGAIHMMAGLNVDADLIYKVTKSVVEHRDELGAAHIVYSGLTPQIMGDPAVVPSAIPWHPGSQKYFKELGVLK
jgi:TRAP transporter TAXI family solute receptor